MAEPTDHYAELRAKERELTRLRECFAPVNLDPDMVVMVTPTIEDGYVVRWYRNIDTASRGSERVSASRNAVNIHVPIHFVPVDLIVIATDVRRMLRRDDVEPVKALATHRRKVFGDELEPILRAVP